MCVITPLCGKGDEKATARMRRAAEQYGVTYTGKNVRFKIQQREYEVGVHRGRAAGIDFYLLNHHEFFDGLYWGGSACEKLRSRLAFARAAAELIATFRLEPGVTISNDAFAGIFNGVVRADPYYAHSPAFARTTFVHVIHNGDWQYWDCFERYEGAFDRFRLFNLPEGTAGGFCDPVDAGRINCMAAGYVSPTGLLP